METSEANFLIIMKIIIDESRNIHDCLGKFYSLKAVFRVFVFTQFMPHISLHKSKSER